MAESQTNPRHHAQYTQPAHDPVHEADGGDDVHSLVAQQVIQALRAELDALTFKLGIAFARDGVNGKVLVPELVRKARAGKTESFKRIAVYKVVPRLHQRQHGGSIIGTRWVYVNEGDAESPN